MQLRKSRNRTLEEWAELLAFLRENENQVRGIEAQRARLEALYAETLSRKQLRDAQAAGLRETTFKLSVGCAEGQANVSCIRAAIREQLGVKACEIPLRLRRRPPIDG